MKIQLNISGYMCDCVSQSGSSTVTYLIYPGLEPMSDEWLEKTSRECNISIVALYVPADEWNNVLTPWPEPGEVKGFPPFAGEAPKFLSLLQDEIIPKMEKALSLPATVNRDLVGVSLSGLFALWQWILCDTFRNIGCLSGSFWYEGFLDWFEKQTIPEKRGKAFFLLGEDEPKAHIKAYRSVGTATETIVAKLKAAGIPVTFQWVPGNHFSDPVHRADMTFRSLYS